MVPLSGPVTVRRLALAAGGSRPVAWVSKSLEYPRRLWGMLGDNPERDAATTGASIGASIGAKGGPFSAGIGAGLGGALGYLAGAVSPCGKRKMLPDGGHPVEEQASGGVTIPVEDDR